MSRNSITVALLTLLPLLNACSAGSASPPCFLQVSLYDGRGNALPFKITKITGVEGDTQTNLLTAKGSPLRLAARSQLILFPEAALRADLDVTLTYGDRREVKRRVTLAECQQRWSVQVVGFDPGEIVGGASTAAVSGRLTGCTLVGDWWIRAIPMHGQGFIGDGYIDPSDGSFRVPVATTVARHILVIGKEKTPLKSLAIDVTPGEKNDTGLVDLSGSCPK